MPLNLVNSGVTGPKFTKFLHNEARLSPMNLSKLELRYSTRFRNDKTTNGVESADFANFGPKNWLPWQRPLTDQKKGGQINNLRPYTYYTVKI